ncbi:MAG: hypothetical protein NXI02_24960 [Rhodobacteraceae bacterium]|nr:hypothetical protein [Paracoccaceae bacterium]
MSGSNDLEKQRELRFAEIEAIRKRGHDAHMAYRGLSATFSSMAIRSALLLNGGAMFAGLAFIGALARSDSEESVAGGFIAASVCFIFGIATAALAAFMAYENYEAQSDHEQCTSHKDVLNMSVKFFPEDHKNGMDKVDADNKHWDKEIDFHENKIVKTQRWAIRYGIASYLFFIAACIIVGETMATA